MEDMKEKRKKIVSDIERVFFELDPEALKQKRSEARERLFDFANYLEAKIVLLYLPRHAMETPLDEVIESSYQRGKIVVLPAFEKDTRMVRFYKVDSLSDLSGRSPENMEPNPKKCRELPVENIDIALIPGIAFDEKGSRVGLGLGNFDRMVTRLPPTTRKVALSIEEQLAVQIPLESKGKYMDIIITDKRTIYKI